MVDLAMEQRHEDMRNSSLESGDSDEMVGDVKDHGSRDKKRKCVRSKERAKESRPESKGRMRDDRYREKGHDRTKIRSRERDRERDHNKDYYKDKERDLERGKDKRKDSHRDHDVEKEKSYDRDQERNDDRGKSKGRDHDKEKDLERDKDSSREYGLHVRDRDKNHKGDERSRARERDHGRELERDRRKEKGHDKEKTRDMEREKDHIRDDRVKDRKRERDGLNERESDRDREKLEKDRKKEFKEKAIEEGDYEKQETKQGKGKEATTVKFESIEDKIASKIGDYVQNEPGFDEKSAQHHDSNSELQTRVLKIKEERRKRESDGDGDSEISSWVAKSRRQQMNTEKEKAARLSKVLEEQESAFAESENEDIYEPSGNSLAGAKILHGLDKAMEGGAVVLTLKDQSILADGDVNEEVDKLENVEIGEQKHRDEAYRAGKKKTGIYVDKFNEDPGSHKVILPQYDDPVEDEGVTLDETGRFGAEADKKLAELRRRLEGGSTNKTYEDLSSAGRVLSEYYTPEEMLQFKKPKKKKSLRKKDKLDLDALEAEAISAGLGAGDLGSRKVSQKQAAREEQARAEAENRSNAYRLAYAKAEEASKILRHEQTLVIKTVEDSDLVFGEDYKDLQKSLERARKLALKKQDEEVPSVPQAVALLAASNKEQRDNDLSLSEPQENKVVITEMEEFVLGLQFNEEGQKAFADDVFMDEDEETKPTEVEVGEDRNGWTEMEEVEVVPPSDDKKDDALLDEIIHEPAVGKGLSGALKLLKERGTLNEDIDWGGRSMDKKKSKLVGINDTDGQKEIHIERTDEFGRIMTPKEAFRMISHKFHGKGPGKMKQEKRMINYQKDLQTKKMKASDTPSLAMEKMREAQARQKTPYLVLSGNVKPGQTSDPRSGFATVEKDHLGSLTPMLGDKKVEHFLGIDRTSNSCNMGPPPPRKPKT